MATVEWASESSVTASPCANAPRTVESTQNSLCKPHTTTCCTPWDCSKAKKVYAFCNGPVCPQSPTAINAMVRDGFPVDKIYYYRGGMLDWDALGFPIVKDEF